MNVENIEEWWEFSEMNDKVFIVPISETEKQIRNVLERWNKWTNIRDVLHKGESWEIINFSGIMSTTPREIMRESSNLHFLFWPKAKSWLTTIFAWKFSESVKIILDNSIKAWVNIIESTAKDHDIIMARVQWLTHLVILMSWINFDMKSELTHEWNTPSWTIADMIFSNPYFDEVSKEFIKRSTTTSKSISKLFVEIIKDTMDERMIHTHSTPTFRRVFKFCENNDIFINQKIIDFMNSDFKHRLLLEDKIKEIQNVDLYTKLKN